MHGAERSEVRAGRERRGARSPSRPEPRRAAAGRAARDRVLAAVPPGAGAAVMGTGIVSVALGLDGRAAASDALLAATGLLAAVLAAARVAGLRCDPRRLAREAREPATLTVVAAACVLGTRLTGAGWSGAGAALLAFAVAAWAPLTWTVLRHWRTPARGTGFLLAVATQAIAMLCAALAIAARAAWPAYAALPPIAVGLGLYAYVASAFDRGELTRANGDQWVAGGALAIAALAVGAAARALRLAHAAAAMHAALGALALGVWALAMAWLPALVLAELVRPRLRVDARRWSTVFPVGMYAAMSFVVGQEQGVDWMVAFARVWTLVAVAVWAAVAAATARRAARMLRGGAGHRRDDRRVAPRHAGTPEA
jgi:hypothetical protein